MVDSKILISDVDGVITDGTFTYTAEGKVSKVFGPHDADGVKMLKSNGWEVKFITADSRGFEISKKRVNDMGCDLLFAKETERLKYIEQTFGYDIAYIGDGLHDAEILNSVRFGIAPANSVPQAISAADYVLKASGGAGALLEAALILINGIPRPNQFTRAMREITDCVGEFESINENQLANVINLLAQIEHERIFCIGAGRMGYAAKGFAMRLSHLGFNSFFISDAGTPSVHPGDILFVASSTGNTPTIVYFTDVAKKAGATVISITTDGTSKIALMSDILLLMNRITTNQFMKTVYEQSVQIVFDIIANTYREKYLKNTNMEKNHSIFE